MKAGAGHIKAAEAIHAAFQEKYPEYKVENIDLLDYSSPMIKFLYGKSYLEVLKKFPGLYAHGYKNYEGIKGLIRPRSLPDRFHFEEFFALIERAKPDCVIATHFIPASVLEHYRLTKRKNFRLVVTLTDYEMHPLWLVERADLFTVATEEMRFALAFDGIDPKKIRKTGIPVHPKFLRTYDRVGLRKKYGLGIDQPIILLTAGSFGMTPITRVISSLKHIKRRFQLLVVCGNNDQLKKELTHLQKTEPRLKLVFGFVDCMEELMAISDVIITKPGGITTTESMASGLPMILVDPIPGQEEANAYYLIAHGVARYAGTLPALLYHIDVLLKHPELRAGMKQACKTTAPGNAAFSIAKEITTLFRARPIHPQQ